MKNKVVAIIMSSFFVASYCAQEDLLSGLEDGVCMAATTVLVAHGVRQMFNSSWQAGIGLTCAGILIGVQRTRVHVLEERARLLNGGLSDAQRLIPQGRELDPIPIHSMLYVGFSSGCNQVAIPLLAGFAVAFFCR